MAEEPAYNERLFSKGVRSRFHFARFHWFKDVAGKLFNRPVSVLELGCYDAKTISFLPFPPERYVGFDANWENGLDIARANYTDKGYEFHECHSPEEMDFGGAKFDLVVCMETLEHLPEEMLAGYLEKLKSASKGVMLVSVPNEIGLVFLGKFLVKLLVYREKMNPKYSFGDVVNQVLGRIDRVVHDDHKGFSYRRLKEILEKDWKVSMNAIPFRWLPISLGFSVGMVCNLRSE